MRKIVFLLCFVYCLFSCVHAQVSHGSDSTAYYRQKLAKANDSIKVLNQRTVMSSRDFVRIYKYERLLKYYRICKKKPTQWKYYKGWSTRVFEQ